MLVILVGPVSDLYYFRDRFFVCFSVNDMFFISLSPIVFGRFGSALFFVFAFLVADVFVCCSQSAVVLSCFFLAATVELVVGDMFACSCGG